jgi:PAS domain S-box-containing protein
MNFRIVYVRGPAHQHEAVVAALDALGSVTVVESVAALREQLGRADVVVTAASLPDGDAVDICTLAAGVPVVVYAADPDPSLASALFAVDAADYVLRDEAAPDRLADRVRAVLDRDDGTSRYRQLVEAAGDFVYCLDAEGRYTMLNDAAVSLTGYSREEALGEHASLLLDAADIERGEAAIRRLLRGESDTETFEVDVHPKEGRPRRVENHVALLPMPDGEFRGTVGVIRDVTERHRRDERLRELHDATRDLFTADDRERVAEIAVEAARSILGYPINGVRFREGDRLVPVVMAEATTTTMGDRPVYDLGSDQPAARAVRTGEPVAAAGEGAHEALARSYHVPLGDHGVLSVGRTEDEPFDATDRMLARVLAANTGAALDRLDQRTELAAERDRFAALFENIPDPAIYVEFEGGEPVVRDANSAFEGTFGHDRETLLGESVDEFVVPPGATDEASAYNESILSGESFHGEVRRLAADGPRDFLLHVVPYEIGERTTRGFAIYTDITNRKRRERELERQNERLDRFASVVSHDLRNPLNVAAGRLELARETGDGEHLDAVARALDRMEELVDGLLALARQGRLVGDTESVALAEQARAAWAGVETGDATLAVEPLPTVRADAPRLAQLFENLYRNAVEHGSTSERAVTVTVGPLPDGSGFYVADDGPGIPADDRERVFEFGHSGSDGTGFGLAIVRGIAEAHGWRVSATEGESGGARFEFRGVESG